MTPEIILKTVCKELDITKDEVMQYDQTPGARQLKSVFGRRLCMAISKIYRLGNEKEIGNAFNRDRTSVYAAVKSVCNDIETDKKRKVIYYNILNTLSIIEPLKPYSRLFVSCPKPPMGYDDVWEWDEVSIEALSYQIPK